jgi:hypothetical protein
LRSQRYQIAISSTGGLPGLVCLVAAGALVGLCLVGNAVTDTGGRAVLGTSPILAVLGFFALLLLVRFCQPLASGFGAAAWGAGAAMLAAGSDPAAWIAYIAGPAGFAVIASLLTRHFGFRALIIAVLWLLIELAMMASSLAPRGMLAALAEGSALFSGVAAYMGSIHVALLLALVSAGMVAAAAAVMRAARRRCSIDFGFLRPVNRADEQILLQAECGTIVMPRAPPVRR